MQNIMKTIAITIEEDILERIDRLAGKGGGSRKRSQVIRTAVREYLTRSERLADEEREGEILRKNRGRLARQAAALVKEQAKS